MDLDYECTVLLKEETSSGLSMSEESHFGLCKAAVILDMQIYQDFHVKANFPDT